MPIRIIPLTIIIIILEGPTVGSAAKHNTNQIMKPKNTIPFEWRTVTSEAAAAASSGSRVHCKVTHANTNHTINNNNNNTRGAYR